MNKVKLADAVEQLRKELSDAAERGASEDLQFDVDEIELQLAVEMEKAGGPSGKVSFNVLGVGAELGGEASISKSNSHVVTLKLKPRGDASGKFAVSSDVQARPKQ